MNFNFIAGQMRTIPTLANSEAWATFLEKQEQFSSRATQVVNQIMPQLPEEVLPACLELLQTAIKQTDAVSFEKHVLGAWFTMSRLMERLKEGKEDISVSSRTYSVPNPDGIEFEAIKGSDGIPISRKIIIDDHFTIFRDGKPFIYKAKYQPMRHFGSIGRHDPNDPKAERNAYHDHNLLLKYQAAIEAGLIAGAAIEVRGLIDLKFLEWAFGTNAFNPGAVPDVQIIYNMQLPSGAEYRFTLKKTSEIMRDLTVENPTHAYTSEDLAVIRGIESALSNPSQREIYEIISGYKMIDQTKSLTRVFNDNKVGTPDGTLTYDDIKDYDTYSKIKTGLDEARWKRAADIRPERYNLNSDTIFSDRNAGIEDDLVRLEEMIEAYQETLRSRPELAKTKTNYILGELGTKEYDRKKAEVVEVFRKNISLVRAAELERRHSPAYDSLSEERKMMGWNGPKEGIGLSIEHIMFDSIVEVVAQGPNKKGRSYEGANERFMTIDNVMQHLEREQEREVYQMQFYDPIAKEVNPNQKSLSTFYRDASRQKHERLVLDSRRTNIKRALEFLDSPSEKTKALYARNKIKRNTAGQRAAYTAVKDEIDDLRAKVQDARDSIEAANAAVIAESRRTKVKFLGDEHPLVMEREKTIQSVIDHEIVLWKKLETLFDSGTRRKLFTQVFSRKENIMKFIYAVDNKNHIVFDEEARKHSNFGRASHSELVSGQFCYGAGEMVFFRNDNTEKWILKEINNGSGHYRPPTQSLTFASQCFVRELCGYYQRNGSTPEQSAAASIEFVEKSRLTDAIARGRPLRDAEIGLTSSHILDIVRSAPSLRPVSP